MNPTVLSLPLASAPAPGKRPMPSRLWRLEARYEFVKLLRMPAFSLPTFTFPVLFYVLFGIGFGFGKTGSSVSMATYLLATYGCFGVFGIALFGFGVGLATERGQGLFELKQTTPMPTLAPFVAKLSMSLLFGLILIGLLFGMGIGFGGVHLTAVQGLTLAGVLLLGAIPFGALGLGLGSLVSATAAAPVINLVYLPMAVISGLWMPVAVLPGVLKSLAPLMPAYHHSQLALKVLGASQGEPIWWHLAILVLWTGLSLAVGVYGMRRGEDKSHGS